MTYPICSEKLAALIHVIHRFSDVCGRLQTFMDTLLYTRFEFMVVASRPTAILQLRKVAKQKRPVSEDHGMPVGQIQNIFLALEDGYKRHVGHRVEKMSDVCSPLDELLCVDGCKGVLVISRGCVDGVDVAKNHAQYSRHPAILISLSQELMAWTNARVSRT